MGRLSADGETKSEIGEAEHGEKSLQRKPQTRIGLSKHVQDKRDGDDCAQGCSALLKPARQDRRPCRMCPAPQIEAPNLVHFVRLFSGWRKTTNRFSHGPTRNRGTIDTPAQSRGPMG